MSWKEFLALPPDWRWKREYIDGKAMIRPREACISVARAVAGIPAPDPLLAGVVAVPFTPPHANERDAWGAAYRAAFDDTPDFCGYDDEIWEQHLPRWLDRYVARSLPESIVLKSDSGQAGFLGTALLRRTEKGVLLESLMIAPTWRRQGLATQMLRLAADRLRRMGEATLHSGYHPLNAASQAWHLRQGFEEVPSWYTTEMRLREAQSWQRLIQTGEQTEAASGKSLPEWESEIMRLKDLQAQLQPWPFSDPEELEQRHGTSIAESKAV